MKVAIHQPNFLPWIGYFYKMFLSDAFVILDDVPFSKSGYTKRVKILKDRHDDELIWLTVPVKKYHQHTLINELETETDKEWWDKHKRHLQQSYGHLPNYKRTIGLLDYAISEAGSNKLSDINNSLISYISNDLYVNPQVLISSAVELKEIDSEDVNIILLKSLEVEHYISGKGGDSYQDESEYEAHGIKKTYADIQLYLQSPEGILANPLKVDISTSIFGWLACYSNAEILTLFRQAEAAGF